MTTQQALEASTLTDPSNSSANTTTEDLSITIIVSQAEHHTGCGDDPRLQESSATHTQDLKDLSTHVRPSGPSGGGVDRLQVAEFAHAQAHTLQQPRPPLFSPLRIPVRKASGPAHAEEAGRDRPPLMTGGLTGATTSGRTSDYSRLVDDPLHGRPDSPFEHVLLHLLPSRGQPVGHGHHRSATTAHPPGRDTRIELGLWGYRSCALLVRCMIAWRLCSSGKAKTGSYLPHVRKDTVW
jgi:hypothetical protein